MLTLGVTKPINLTTRLVVTPKFYASSYSIFFQEHVLLTVRVQTWQNCASSTVSSSAPSLVAQAGLETLSSLRRGHSMAAILIFSVSFQFLHMSRRTERLC